MSGPAGYVSNSHIVETVYNGKKVLAILPSEELIDGMLGSCVKESEVMRKHSEFHEVTQSRSTVSERYYVLQNKLWPQKPAAKNPTLPIEKLTVKEDLRKEIQEVAVNFHAIEEHRDSLHDEITEAKAEWAKLSRRVDQISRTMFIDYNVLPEPAPSTISQSSDLEDLLPPSVQASSCGVIASWNIPSNLPEVEDREANVRPPLTHYEASDSATNNPAAVNGHQTTKEAPGLNIPQSNNVGKLPAAIRYKPSGWIEEMLYTDNPRIAKCGEKGMIS
jgi:hypothetical protein